MSNLPTANVIVLGISPTPTMGWADLSDHGHMYLGGPALTFRCFALAIVTSLADSTRQASDQQVPVW